MGILLFGFVREAISTGFIGFVLIIALLFLSFFLIREITLWYFKINKNTETLENISLSLEKIAIAIDFLARDVDVKNHHKEKKDRVIKNNINDDKATTEESA